jgi:hypothetical protein
MHIYDPKVSVINEQAATAGPSLMITDTNVRIYTGTKCP